MRARFDNLTPGSEQAFELASPARTIAAHRPEEVVPALETVERLVAEEGLWAAGFVGYEAGPGLDERKVVRDRSPEDAFAGLPLVWFGLFREYHPLAPAGHGDGSGYVVAPWVPSVDRRAYDRGIAAIRGHIAAGDSYQVNYTIRLRSAFAGDPEAFYETLALGQRGAYNSFLDTGRYQIVSASPELFFEMDGGRLESKPMKGTAPRGRWPAEDALAASALAASRKEQAENLMIVDLLRNDMGRLATFGSVAVEELFRIERFPTVWQMTSTISCQLRPEVRLVDVFRSLFPCGSVTGAPKLRTMELIAGLEESPRGVYCGAVGYLAPPRRAAGELPDACFNVAIRTVVVDSEEGISEYGVGGGITWDSSSEGEYEECRTKARVLVQKRAPFGLLETLRWDDGYWWAERHLDRMEASAAYFGLGFNRNEAAAVLERAEAECAGPSRVRLVLDSDGKMLVDAAALEDQVEVERLAIDHEPVDSRDPLLFHKTTDRRTYERRAARHPECDDVLLVNERGFVTEASRSNLLVRLEGRWWTPSLSSGCLPGIMRAVLLEEGVIAEKSISIGDVENAESLALVNSLRLRRPAVLVGSALAGERI